VSPKPPSLDSLSLTPSSPPFAFNIVIPDFDQSLATSSPTPKLRSAISRKLVCCSFVSFFARPRARSPSLSLSCDGRLNVPPGNPAHIGPCRRSRTAW
jgi:hypothetical protein